MYEIFFAALFGATVALAIALLSLQAIIGRSVRRAFVETREREIVEANEKAAAEADRRARLVRNPWNKAGTAYNITRQIEYMREDFERAVLIAAEAGVDITSLRGVDLYVPVSYLNEAPHQEGYPAETENSFQPPPDYFAKSKPAKRKRSKRGA